MTDPIATKVLEIVAAHVRRSMDEISPDQSPAELGLDSLNLVEMVFAIEEAFDITIPFSVQDGGEEGFDTATIGSLIEAVRDQVAAKVP